MCVCIYLFNWCLNYVHLFCSVGQQSGSKCLYEEWLQHFHTLPLTFVFVLTILQSELGSQIGIWFVTLVISESCNLPLCNHVYAANLEGFSMFFSRSNFMFNQEVFSLSFNAQLEPTSDSSRISLMCFRED